MAEIVEISGNIFNSKCDALVNTVNCMGVMGKGLALEFKFRFYNMFIEYKKLCEEGKLKPGKLHFWTKSKPYIINFPTKYHWKFPSKIPYIEDGLKDFSNMYIKYNIKSVAFPELGTNLGKLSWNQIKDIMYSNLKSIKNIYIEIYHYNPETHDNLFLKLKDKIKFLGKNDFIKNTKINKKQGEILMKIINQTSINKMIDLYNVKGLGEKTLMKIYKYVMNDETKNQKEQLIFNF